MLALTIRQPFVWEIFAGIKKREYRSWPTTHRGPLVIHAATSTTSLVKGWRDVVITDDGKTAGELLNFGAIVGVVDVTGCEWDKGKECYAWHLARPRLLVRPIECKGRLKLWAVPGGIEKELLDSGDCARERGRINSVIGPSSEKVPAKGIYPVISGESQEIITGNTTVSS